MTTYEGDLWAMSQPTRGVWRHANEQIYHDMDPANGGAVYASFDIAKGAKGATWVEVRDPVSSQTVAASQGVAAAAPSTGGYIYTVPQAAAAAPLPSWMLWAGIGLAAWFFLKK